ncbi:hypothetical protein ALC62_12870 [Cyphomyrmex costatus]|uniref:Uncharacterized protein n=1 Tax=Cyphomyrmex costatus TaxID=456900 RepID=A0A195C8R0_9HYME|nr:hypothetical protein ALC62_12870 [Cyphomyrmex costatus]
MEYLVVSIRSSESAGRQIIYDDNLTETQLRPFHATLSRRVASCRVTSCPVTSPHFTSCHITAAEQEDSTRRSVIECRSVDLGRRAILTKICWSFRLRLRVWDSLPGGNFHPSWKLGGSNPEERKWQRWERLMSKYNYGLRNTGLAGQGSQVGGWDLPNERTFTRESKQTLAGDLEYKESFVSCLLVFSDIDACC